MGLVIKAQDGYHLPVIVCDHCQQEIIDANGGNYQWVAGVDPPGSVYYTHKECCDAFEQAHPLPNDDRNLAWYAMELTCLPIYLGNNLHLNWAEAHQRADSISLMG